MLKASSERPCYRQQKSHWYAFAICYPRSVLLLNHWPPLSRRQKDDLLVLFIHQSQGSVVLRNFVFIVTFEKGRSSRIVYSSVTGFCFSSLIRVLCHFWERTTFSYYLFISHRVLLFFVNSCFVYCHFWEKVQRWVTEVLKSALADTASLLLFSVHTSRVLWRLLQQKCLEEMLSMFDMLWKARRNSLYHRGMGGRETDR